MTVPKLTLYVGEGCPYCKKVLDHLKKDPLPMEIKEIWENEEASAELQALTERTTVPCLKINEKHMFESDDIIAMLKKIKAEEKSKH